MPPILNFCFVQVLHNDEKVTKVLFERMAELFPGIRFFITYTYSDGSESGHIELKKQVVCYVRSGNNEAKLDAH